MKYFLLTRGDFMFKCIFSFLFLSLLTFFSHFTFAACSLSQGTRDDPYILSTRILTMPINRTISVPSDVQPGQEIYRQYINLKNMGIAYVTCDSTAQFYGGYEYANTPLPFYNASQKIYETGVSGIGIKFTSSADFPYTVAICGVVRSCAYNSGWSAYSYFSLIKTANVVVPDVIQGIKLPTVVYSFGQIDSMAQVYKITLSGNITITVPTCNITPASQSMTVNMGKYDIAAFTGKDATTPWKNASIQLTNCGQFYGNSQGGNTMATFDGSAVTYYNLNNNFLSITLTPLNGIEDAAKGIMKIKDQPLKATGVGIQLSTSESTSGLVNLASPVTQTLPKDGTQSITVPLYARYIQTEDSVKAGKADGRLEYVITYQ
ncbi:fimbrial protein [Citrobacter sp. BDA59-3]|uniref:fimbrial protein n=1 Tax=Citrobacter sp. BDA59-3 TaxID=2781952 RepID=UPI0018821819|nr:fimbrial protein [Citrobacter sp. BDA59-3]QOV67341.1 type 1 fimbrial protein [Citrobacter sp. BDA59-3]